MQYQFTQKQLKYCKEEAESFFFPILPENFDKLNALEQNRLVKCKEASNNRIIKRIARNVKIEKKVHFHIARRTFATRAIEVGADLSSISKMMGHKSTKQTEGYIIPNQAHLDSIIDKL